MEVNWLYALLVVACGVSVALGVDPCAPDCDGKAPGDVVENPYNCNEYYLCLGDGLPSDHAISCGPDKHFNPDTGLCEDGKECDPTCSPNTCRIACNATLDLIPDLTNCSNYFFCLPGGVSDPQSCPADRPYFDGVNCIKDKGQCCVNNLCTATCETGATQVADPKNCSNFYICVEPGPVDEALLFSCGEGENFDIALGRCVAGAPCVILCGDGSGGGGSGNDTSSDCLESYTCTDPDVEFVAKCKSCQQEYFHCLGVGESAVVERCTGDLVFNPLPEYPFCLLPSNCPYPPTRH